MATVPVPRSIVTRHSAASVVSLTLRKRNDATAPGRVELRIVDNGRGFDVNNVTPGHLGLSIMRERADGIGAELVLRAAPGHGTDLTVVT